jgi:hypothetical protein
MRTWRILAAVAVLSLLAVFPVPALAGDVWLGVNGNFTSAELSNTDLKGSTAFGGGVVAEFGLSKRFSLVLQPNLLVRETTGTEPPTSGFRFCIVTGPFQFCTTTPGSPGYDFTTTVSYVDVPMLAKFSLREKGFMPYLLAGPSVGFVTSAKLKPSNGSEIDIKDEMNGTDFGICGGLGFDLPLGESARIFLEGQYVLGLTDAGKDDDEHSKFKTFVVKAGFQFAVSRSKS